MSSVMKALIGAMCVVALFACGAAWAETRLAVIGDSLTAGYGLAPGEAFPARLEAALAADGFDVRVIDAGVSGDTTAGGRRRLDWLLADAPHAVIVELGANDGLRGIHRDLVFANLDAILTRLASEGVAVLLTGMRAPPNYGFAYADAFKAIYPELAAKHGIALYPFFLDGVAARPELNQNDGLHPNARGVAVIVEGILPDVKRLLETVNQQP